MPQIAWNVVAKLKTSVSFLLLCILIIVGASVSPPATAQTATPVPEPPDAIERVIVISLDGARPDAIQQANAPTLQRLAAEGAVDWAARTVDPSVTLPSHASMLTGLSVEEHGLNHNDSLYPCPTLEAPTFVTVAADHNLKAAMVVGKEKMCIFHQSDRVDYTFAREGDRSVADRVIALLDEDDYAVIFAHFPNPDYFGHSTGWMSDTYISELYSTDYQIGRIVAALEEHGIADETLLIISADHGGHDDGHGTTLPEDVNIPWIAYGAGIAAGTRLEGVSTTDTAATVLWALDLPLPDSDSSRPTTEAFAVEDAP